MSFVSKWLLAISLIPFAACLVAKAQTPYTNSSRHHPRRKYLRERPPRDAARRAVAHLNSSCAKGCTVNGVCNEELGRCDCPRHRHGPDCTAQVTDLQALCNHYGLKPDTCFKIDHTLCLNQCNQRGKCKAGFCHCKPGYWGSDCALSKGKDGKPSLLEGQGYTTRKRPPRIYVYELPPELNLWVSTSRLDRPLFLLFWQQLLSSGVRTADGDSADYYFVPVRLRMGDGDSSTAVRAIQYIRKTWPWWDSHDGGRHLLIQTGDMGRIESSAPLLKLTENSIWLTHWGLTKENRYAGWPASHRPGQDIVLPVFVQPGLVRSYGMYHSPLHPAFNQSSKARTQMMFFAGRICGNRKAPREHQWPNCDSGADGADVYSAGVRQLVHYHHWNRTAYKIVVNSKTYAQDMATFKYCLAPTGGGHGKRNVLVSLMGCIPVTVTDNVMQPFEPELHWDRFAVAVPEADIPRLDGVLQAFSPEAVQEFQHLFWSTTHGGIMGESGAYDAFNTLMEILRVRLVHPGVPPEKLVDVDDEFRRFMDCDLHAVPPSDPDARLQLCSYSEVTASAFHCRQCRTRVNQNFLLPGGAICCNQRKLGQCPRLWE